MTIAVCCVSPEGVVLGADSTTSVLLSDGFHFLNHAQKLFEIGEGGLIGAVTWGLASLGNISHRTQFAKLGDALRGGSHSVPDVATMWAQQFWAEYENATKADRARFNTLAAKSAFDPSAATSPSMRTEAEQREHDNLWLGLRVGFCLAGRSAVDREPQAAFIEFDPATNSPPVPSLMNVGETRCWGMPRVFARLVKGADPQLAPLIQATGKWTGTQAELEAVLDSQQLYPAALPIRDAVDFVYSLVLSTIKTLKHSHLSQTCGGPIEVAVVTTDRAFRWVRHKEWDAAIQEGHSRWKI